MSTAYTIGSNGLNSTRRGDGSLLISGYLTRWDELDRTGDVMIRGSWAKAIPEFLASPNRPLVYAHRLRDVLGSVQSLVEDSVGVKMTAVLNPRSSLPAELRWVYDSVVNGSLRGLSAMALWRKITKPDGTRDIVDASDIVEASITATPALRSTSFEVISSGKALELLGLDDTDQLRRERDTLRNVGHRLDLLAMRLDVHGAMLRARA